MEITVYPPEAAAAGCTAAYSVMLHDESPPGYKEEYGIGWVRDYYQLTATKVYGWRFDHFEWDFDASGAYTEHRHESRYFDNPYPSDAAHYDYVLFDGSDEVNYQLTTYVTSNCRAVFTRIQSLVEIKTTCVYPRPQGGYYSGGGSVSPHMDSKLANVGETSTFSFVATADSGFRFVKWEYTDGTQIGTTTTLTLAKVHTEDNISFYIYAVFEKMTGFILRSAASGKILRGASGNILRDD